MRRLRLATIVLFVLASLTGCSPSAKPSVAITIRDGRPTVILLTCVDLFSQLDVYDASPTPTTSPKVLVNWHVHGTAATEVIEVPVFGEPPAGWETTGVTQVDDPSQPWSFRVEPLRELVQGVQYRASGSSLRHAHTVDFTVAELDRLKEGYVFTSDRDGERQTVAFEKFVRQAPARRGSCENA